MKNDRKPMALLAQIAKGLLIHGRRNTASQLGDRMSYVGMSDMGKAMQCMRGAVADKLIANHGIQAEDVDNLFTRNYHQQIQAYLEREMVLQRGHWLETGIAQALIANGSQIIPQLEIETSIISGEHTIPIKAHLDFTLVRGGELPAVRVLELKSTNRLPKTLYPAYETQLYGQLGLLTSCWNKRCFNMRAEDGSIVFSGLTFPEAVKRLFGEKLPETPAEVDAEVDMEGWVLCMSMNKAKPFGPYHPTESMLAMCLRVAGELWNHVHEMKHSTSLDAIPYCRGFHPLCDWCGHAANCPKFKCKKMDDSKCESQLAQLEDLKSRRKVLEDEIKTLEQRIAKHHSLMASKGEWVQVGGYRFKVSMMNGRTTLNKPRLISALAALKGDEKAHELIRNASDMGKSYDRLFVSRHEAKDNQPTEKQHEQVQITGPARDGDGRGHGLQQSTVRTHDQRV